MPSTAGHHFVACGMWGVQKEWFERVAESLLQTCPKLFVVLDRTWKDQRRETEALWGALQFADVIQNVKPVFCDVSTDRIIGSKMSHMYLENVLCTEMLRQDLELAYH